MLEPSEIRKYPLDEVLKKSGELLAESEYLIDRLDICQPRDFISLRMSGKCDAEYGTALLKVTFLCSKKQAKALKELLGDESKADDLDSGVGEVFTEAISKAYPRRDWDCCVGGTEWAVEASDR